MLRVLQLSLFVGIFIPCTFAAANQNEKKLTISGTYTYKELFRIILQQTGRQVSYSSKTINDQKVIRIDVKEATIDNVLTIALKGKKIHWILSDNYISLSEDKPVSQELQPMTPGDTLPQHLVSGLVTDTLGTPLPGATVLVRGSSQGIAADGNGRFTLRNIKPNSVLEIGYTGYEKRMVVVEGRREIVVILIPTITELSNVEVISTGYQTIAREKTTGSFELVDNKTFNRRVSTSVLDRLEGIVAGVVFNKNSQQRANESSISIRSRGTIFANPNPLIIVDNFPYQGEISSINPNDVESITILKDAASAAIWGALSGNGVIVITTKTGKNNKSVKVSFNSNVTIGERLDLHGIPRLNSTNYLDFEQFLFENKYFNSLESNSNHPWLSPAVEIMIKARDGEISQSEAENKLRQLGKNDFFADQEKYLYRSPKMQQYALNLSGGSKQHNFYASVGYDKTLENVQANDNDRITINAKNGFHFLNNRIHANLGIYYSRRTSRLSGVDFLGVSTPYLSLGTPAHPTSIGRTYRESYIDTAGGGKLLDWGFYPLGEVGLNENATKSNDYRFDAEINYQIAKGLTVGLSYQYASGMSINKNIRDQNSYFVRDLVNRFSQVNYSTGQVMRPIPEGAIIDKVNTLYESYNIRGQLNYALNWKDNHELNAILGAEQRENDASKINSKFYGYNRETETDVAVDYFADFLQFISPFKTRIPRAFSPQIFNSTNRFRSYFFSGSYRLLQRYSISGSVRRDESNIFGVKTNQKGVPLWSIGVAWELNNEEFYRVGFLPYLKIRASYGYNGNVDNSLSAYATAIAGGNNLYNSPYLAMRNPPNPSLRWEKNRVVNIGMDFKLIKNLVTGSVDYYHKTGLDLISASPIDPTTGITTFTGNTANIKGHGFDLTLNAMLINRVFKWSTAILLSKAVEKVTQYNPSMGRVITYLSNGLINPIVGNPVYGIYAYKWAGLDPVNGDPQLLFNDKPSKDYVGLVSTSEIKNLQYMGNAKPVFFGSFMNTIQLFKFTLSANVTYKFKYYFKKPVMMYSALMGETYMAFNNEYENRWKQPGDEMITTVPSRSYPLNSTRDLVYSNADIHVVKGDHIRLQDIRLEYPFHLKITNAPVNLNVYAYVNNVGVIWAANKYGIDPDFVGLIRIPRSYAIGFNLGF